MDNINKLSFRNDVVKNGKTFYKFEFVICCELNDTFLRTDNFKKGICRVKRIQSWKVPGNRSAKNVIRAEKSIESRKKRTDYFRIGRIKRRADYRIYRYA